MEFIPKDFITIGGLLGLLYGVIHGTLTVKRQFRRNGVRVSAESYVSDLQATERRIDSVERTAARTVNEIREVRAEMQDLRDRVRPLELAWERVERLLESLNEKLSRISAQLEAQKDE